MRQPTCKHPSERTAHEAAETLAANRKRIPTRTAKSLGGTVLALVERKPKDRVKKRSRNR